MVKEDKLKSEIRLLKRQLKQSEKYRSQITINFDENIKRLNERNTNSEDDLKKLREVLKREEEGFLNRISNLECSLEDSFEDNSRLQTVISTLGGRINILEKTNRSNIKRFRKNFNYENNTQAVASNDSPFASNQDS